MTTGTTGSIGTPASDRYSPVHRFFAALNSGAIGEDLFTSAATVWVQSRRTDAPWRTYQAGVARFLGLFPEGLSYSVHAIIADGDRAAAQASSYGVLLDGNIFDNAYVFVFDLAGDRIARLAEYFDTKHVYERLDPLEDDVR